MIVRALLLLVVLASNAAAHGRDPYATKIHFQPGNEQHVLAGTTIGLVTSTDGGATWRWTCEEALHYLDPFDPDYAYAQSGSIAVQTFTGISVERGTCSFDPTNLGMKYVSAIAAAGTVFYAAAADGNDAAIYRSTDDGMTFTPLPGSPGMPGDSWRSIEVAPSDPQRIYLAGYRYMGIVKQHLLYVSQNGGATFEPMSSTTLATTDSSLIEIAGIDANADIVYAIVSLETDGGYGLYRSTNAGTTWTKLFSSQDAYGITFLARRSGELVVATRTSGAWRSIDSSANWQPLASPPHISTLVETSTGEVWAGTQNFPFTPGNQPHVPSDGYAIMKSTDLATWTPVFRVQDLAGPACSPGTTTFRECAEIDRGMGTAWCCLVASSLAITSTEVDCMGPRSCGAVAGDITVKPPDGCCQGATQPSVFLGLLVLLIFGHAYRPRRARVVRRLRRPRDTRAR